VVTPWTAEASDHHELALVGLRTDTDYRVHVEVDGPDGPSGVAEADHNTVPYPETLPALDVAVVESARMAPGVTMFDVGSWGVDGGRGRTGGGLVMFDQEGEVVWPRSRPHLRRRTEPHRRRRRRPRRSTTTSRPPPSGSPQA
jgi:hypothetical protein